MLHSVVKSYSPGDLERLIEHVVDVHHATARAGWASAMDAIGELAAQFETVQPLFELVSSMEDQLESHLQREERILFPYVIALERSCRGYGPTPDRSSITSLRRCLYVLAKEHVEEERLLARIRLVTNGYGVPEMAVLAPIYAHLRELDTDLALHSRLEDSVLFPAALRLERAAR